MRFKAENGTSIDVARGQLAIELPGRMNESAAVRVDAMRRGPVVVTVRRGERRLTAVVAPDDLLALARVMAVPGRMQMGVDGVGNVDEREAVQLEAVAAQDVTAVLFINPGGVPSGVYCRAGRDELALALELGAMHAQPALLLEGPAEEFFPRGLLRTVELARQVKDNRQHGLSAAAVEELRRELDEQA